MESLSSLYERAQQQASTSQATSERFTETLDLLQRCEQLVDAAALFSSNEDRDDVHTEHLRYLMVPFLIAELQDGRRTTDQHLRLESAAAAITQYNIFLSNCARYGFLNSGLQRLHGAAEDGRQLDASSLRTAKVEQAKRGMEIKRLLQQLEQVKLRDKRPDQQADSDQAPVGGAAGWDEEDERQIWNLKLEAAAISAHSALPRLQQETELCKHFLHVQHQQQQRPGAAASAGGGSAGREGRGSCSTAGFAAGDAAAKAAMAGRLRDIASQLAGSERQRLAQQVFRPSHTLPTLTVEQQGMIELREAQAREQQQAAVAQAAAAAAAALTEEEREEVERQRTAAWDEFKDDHPFGSGNSKLRPCAL